MTHWNEVINRTVTLTVENASLANQGIYSASYFGDSPLNGAWMRLIVRGLLNSYIYYCYAHVSVFIVQMQCNNIKIYHHINYRHFCYHELPLCAETNSDKYFQELLMVSVQQLGLFFAHYSVWNRYLRVLLHKLLALGYCKNIFYWITSFTCEFKKHFHFIFLNHLCV